VDELSGRLVPDELRALWTNWAGRALIDWSRTVVGDLARQICGGQLRYQLWWLLRLTWSVLLGRAGCPAGRRSVDGHCHRACGTGHHGEPGWGMPFPRQIARLLIIAWVGA